MMIPQKNADFYLKQEDKSFAIMTVMSSDLSESYEILLLPLVEITRQLEDAHLIKWPLCWRTLDHQSTDRWTRSGAGISENISFINLK